MCYSAMVLQDAERLGARYKARIQRELYSTLVSRRLAGEKLYIGKGIEMPFLKSSDSADVPIADAIRQWHSSEVTRIESELFKQKTRLNDAERILAGAKPTKKAENDQRIATDKIEKFLKDLKRHNSLDTTSDADSRIFPFHYVSTLALNKLGERIVMPMRYHMRPHDKDESFDRDFNGCYNARLDNLSKVAWWKAALGKRHGVILVQKFYENVDPLIYAKTHKLSAEQASQKNLVLCFEPDDTEYMFIPVIWDVWQKSGEPMLISGALITDEPQPEIAAAGHDRTPIFLKESAIGDWLTAKGSFDEIKEILSVRERPHYSHKIVSAA